MFKKAKVKRVIRKMKKKLIADFSKNPEEGMFLVLAVLAVVFAGMCFGRIKYDVNAPVLQVAEEESMTPAEMRIRRMTAGSPIGQMAPYIAKKNKKTAAYLVAIAKKESDWGKYAPKKNGKECWNFWGFKGSQNPNEDGYSCFSSPEQAVSVVGKRIDRLVAKKIDTPREMVLWKCGASVAARRTAGSAKWIKDVSLYYRKMM